MLDRSIPGLQKALDLAWKRNEAIASNIANAETPMYRAVDVNFAGELERAFNNSTSKLQKTDAKHLDLSSETQSHLVEDYSGATKPDGNNVDIDIQMGKLSYNRGSYSIAAQLVRKKLQMIRQAIQYGLR